MVEKMWNDYVCINRCIQLWSTEHVYIIVVCDSGTWDGPPQWMLAILRPSFVVINLLWVTCHTLNVGQRRECQMSSTPVWNILQLQVWSSEAHWIVQLQSRQNLRFLLNDSSNIQKTWSDLAQDFIFITIYYIFLKIVIRKLRYRVPLLSCAEPCPPETEEQL